MNVPEDLIFTESHEWIRVEGDVGTVGISDHAQAELTDIVFVEPPPAGKTFKSGEAAAVVESVKSANDIYAPVSGEIIEGNSVLTDTPALVNTDPYGAGWIFKIRISNPGDLNGLKNAAAYREQIAQ